MELRHLRYFLALAEELHFGRAAERLNMTQPPLSQQIRSLEAELAVQLFHRTKRSVALTDAGRAFAEEARTLLAHAEQAARTAQRANRGEIGRLVVGFMSAAVYAILPRILRAFREHSPDVELVLREMPTSEQVEALRNGRIHIGFVRSPVTDPKLAVQPLMREPLVVALPEAHRLAGKPAIALAELAGEPFILFPRELGSRLYDQIVGLCQQAQFSPRVAQEASQMPTIVSLVAAGIGVALVPAAVAKLHGLGAVYRSLLHEPVPEVETALAWRRDDRSSVLHAFLDVVRDLYRVMR